MKGCPQTVLIFTAEKPQFSKQLPITIGELAIVTTIHTNVDVTDMQVSSPDWNLPLVQPKGHSGATYFSRNLSELTLEDANSNSTKVRIQLLRRSCTLEKSEIQCMTLIWINWCLIWSSTRWCIMPRWPQLKGGQSLALGIQNQNRHWSQKSQSQSGKVF